MRKFLDILSLLFLLMLAVMTVDAFVGPRQLPDKVPTHFDATGQVTTWGPRIVLLGLPIGALVLFALMTMVARRPAAFNFPTRVTPRNRPRLEALAVQMISWLKAEVLCLLTWIQHFTIQAARSGRGALPAGFMPVTLGLVFGTILVYFVLFRKASA